MNPQAQDKHTMLPLIGELHCQCPSCGHASIETEEIERTFLYGTGDQAVELSAIVPLRRCRQCGFEFLDAEAEERQSEAVCRHLEVMTPTEIRAIRQKAGGLSRAEFARITRLGEATIGRWERGELIQNAANDQLLYLLTFPDNLIRLRNRVEKNKSSASSSVPSPPCPAFRVLHSTPALREQAARFSLTKAGVA